MPAPPFSVRVTAVILAKVEKLPALPFNVVKSSRSLAAKPVIAAEVTSTEVAESIVFNSAAVAAVASLVWRVIVQAFVSFPSPVLYRVVRSLTLVPEAIVAVTVPDVSFAIFLASVTPRFTVESTVTV